MTENHNRKILLCIGFILLLAAGLFAQEKKLEELLEMNIQDLMNINVTTASKMPQMIKEVPATVRVITADQIKENGYFTLEEALSDLPGFQFRNIQGFNSYVFQRGVPSQNNLILVLVDGIQINELNSGGFYGGGQYNLENVDHIEVVYGPASALYGTNAISGIINIFTKDPETDKGLSVSGLYGSFQTASTNVNYGYYNESKDFGIRISGLYKTSEKANLAGEKGGFNWTDDMENFEDDYSFDAKIKYRNLTYGFVYQNKQVSRSTNYRTYDTEYRDTGTNFNLQFINSYLKHSFNIFKNVSMSSGIYYRNATILDDSIAYITDSAQVGYFRPNHLIGMENMLTYTFKETFSLVGGIVLEKEKLAESISQSWSSSPDEKPPPPLQPNMFTNNLFSIYLQAQLQIIKGLQLTSGTRYDSSDYYGNVLTPRVALVYNKGRYTGKILYTEAFRAPKPWDYTVSAGNPNLEPEDMASLELSASYNFSDNLRLDLSAYRNRMKNVFIKETLDGGYRWINSGQLNTNGFETSLEFRKGHFKSYCNYTYNFSTDENGDIIPEIAKHTLNLGFTYVFSKDIHFNIRGHYFGKRKNPKDILSTGSDIIEPAFVTHLTLSILNLKKFETYIIVKNLFNVEYFHTSNRPPDQYRQPQRTLMVKLAYKF